MTASIIMYRTRYCPYCEMAARLFEQIGAPVESIDVSNDPAMRSKLVEMSGGRRTVPQIFINGESVGGYQDVAALHASGELAKMLDPSA